MLKYIFILCSCLLVFTACKSHKGIKPKPSWVQNRPTDEMYYVGVGIASKLNNPTNYQQIAKKNAVNDLISEIKVSVSSNSVLSQYQNNQAFSQRFESEVKITAMNTIEQFNVVDSWEDKDYFWIYYRLSKEDYKAEQRRKMMAALDQAENFFDQAESLPREQLMQSIRLKVKALVALQLYLNEDLQTVYKGKNVFMVSELVNSIQNQLYGVQLQAKTTTLQGKAGKAIAEPIDVIVQYKSDQTKIPFFPITLFSEQGTIEGTKSTESNQSGIASINITKITDKAPIQVVRIAGDIKSMIQVDSLNITLQNILLAVDVPSTTIRLNVIPLKLYMETNEHNLSNAMQTSYLDAALKNKLLDDGCIFADTKTNADYILKVTADTKANGAIWGNMKSASLDMSISLYDPANGVEIYKGDLHDVKGFQTTDENAGLDAYKTATSQMLEKIYPALQKELGQRK